MKMFLENAIAEKIWKGRAVPSEHGSRIDTATSCVSWIRYRAKHLLPFSN